jgi:hypothetical protein
LARAISSRGKPRRLDRLPLTLLWMAVFLAILRANGSVPQRDVRIDVEMGDIGTADFQRTVDAIGLGANAARRAASQLAPYWTTN